MHNFLSIFGIFTRFGFLCFGGGYVLTPLYVQELVYGKGWMDMQEFSNLLAVSQVTPGPISVNAATFFGFKAASLEGGGAIASVTGAAIATSSLLLPGLIIMLIVLNYVRKLAGGKVLSGIMRGVGPATIGLMIVTFALFLGMSAITIDASEQGRLALRSFRVNPVELVIFIASTYLLTYRKNVKITAVVLICALIGALAAAF